MPRIRGTLEVIASTATQARYQIRFKVQALCMNLDYRLKIRNLHCETDNVHVQEIR